MHPLRTIRRFAGDVAGAAILELVVVLPFIFTLAAVAIEGGFAMYRYHLVAVGVRDAARYLSGIDYTAANVTRAQNIAVFGNIAGTGTARVPGWTTGNLTIPAPGSRTYIDNTSNTYRGADQIYQVTVSATYTYTPIAFGTLLTGGALTFSTSHQERYYGIR